jgi:hypothetical protein
MKLLLAKGLAIAIAFIGLGFTPQPVSAQSVAAKCYAKHKLPRGVNYTEPQRIAAERAVKACIASGGKS